MEGQSDHDGELLWASTSGVQPVTDALFPEESLLLGIRRVKDIGDLQGLKVAYLPKEAENCQPGSLFQIRNRAPASNHSPPE